MARLLLLHAYFLLHAYRYYTPTSHCTPTSYYMPTVTYTPTSDGSGWSITSRLHCIRPQAPLYELVRSLCLVSVVWSVLFIMQSSLASPPCVHFTYYVYAFVSTQPQELPPVPASNS